MGIQKEFEFRILEAIKCLLKVDATFLKVSRLKKPFSFFKSPHCLLNQQIGGIFILADYLTRGFIA